MSFKSDAHRRWWFANQGNTSNEGKTFEQPTKVGWSSDEKERLRREEELIQELHGKK